MSLHLDDRRRAMLAEMGVRVWSPPGERLADPAEQAQPVAAEDVAIAAAVSTATATATAITRARVAQPPVAAADSAAAVPSLDWDALQAQVSGCRACGLCEGRRKTVFGMGSRQAHWMVVGDPPDEQDDLQGEPYAGPAGALLDNMLLAAGLRRDAGLRANGAGNAYLTTVIKCRPPDNRNPDPAELAQCAPYLARQVALLQPRIILVMGRLAAQALLREALPEVLSLPLGKLRGQVYRYQGVPVVATYPPAYLLRHASAKAGAWADLCLAMDALQNG